jgi:hypothetical protein
MDTNYSTAQTASSAQDQRKYDAFMNLERYDKPTFEERLRVGPLPSVSISAGVIKGQILIPM